MHSLHVPDRQQMNRILRSALPLVVPIWIWRSWQVSVGVRLALSRLNQQYWSGSTPVQSVSSPILGPVTRAVTPPACAGADAAADDGLLFALEWNGDLDLGSVGSSIH